MHLRELPFDSASGHHGTLPWVTVFKQRFKERIKLGAGTILLIVLCPVWIPLYAIGYGVERFIDKLAEAEVRRAKNERHD